MIYYVHNVPGRLRVKTPLIKGNSAAASQMEELLRPIKGVNSVITSIVTGSIVVNYEPAITDPAAILEPFKVNGYFDAAKVITNDQYMDEKLEKAGRVVGKALLSFFMDRAFSGTPLSLLTVIL